MISLCDFIQSGKLGAIGLDATRQEVEAAFGAPPDWDAESQLNNAKIWKYGAIEIYFDSHRVWMIFSDNFSYPLNMGEIAFDANGICGQMRAAEVEHWFAENQIEFQRQSFQWCDEGERFEAVSGVTLTLCAEEKGEIARLCSFALLR